ASRAGGRAAELAERVGGRTAPLSRLADELAGADLLLCATSATDFVVGPAQLGGDRTKRPLLVIDAGLPRDVDPKVREVPGVTLLDLEDLNAFADHQMAARRAEIPAALAIVEEELERYRTAVLDRSVAPLVSELRARAESVRQAELERLSGRLATLDESDRALVEEATRRIVAKLLHEPTVQVKRAAGSPRGERLAETLRTLFDL
ncbi:MAG: glutamyl-tRNA reductase, partial [Acidimicrobiaceae bacterium]|nr:glutamyl-tRNA reductase [Acidimicrobiaceae bacterium]